MEYLSIANRPPSWHDANSLRKREAFLTEFLWYEMRNQEIDKLLSEGKAISQDLWDDYARYVNLYREGRIEGFLPAVAH